MAKETADLFQNLKPLEKTRHIYTVSEVTQDIKLILENTFNEIWVEGEVSGVSKIATGTIFFNLKDSTSLLKCVMFTGYAAALKFEIKDGMQVICFGRISVYEKEGKYQLYAQKIEPKGIGSLQLALEQLKQRLEKEGLFRKEHKKPIPYLPFRIGIVTSGQGAAIKDILKVLDRRFKDVQIILRSVRVQGEGSGEEVAGAIKDFNTWNQQLGVQNRIEVLIVGRGGGSIEDLWAFNEEIVARAIYSSKIPIISAVGHERDWTIADLVADLRAPTPSVAAEIVIPKKEDLREKIDDLTEDLCQSLQEISLEFQEAIDDLVRRLSLSGEHILELSNNELDAAVKKLTLLNPIVSIKQHKEKILDLAKQMLVRINHTLKLKQSELAGAIQELYSLNPLGILSRGYSITFQLPSESVLKDTKFVKIGEEMKTRLHKGEIISRVTDIIERSK